MRGVLFGGRPPFLPSSRDATQIDAFLPAPSLPPDSGAPIPLFFPFCEEIEDFFSAITLPLQGLAACDALFLFFPRKGSIFFFTFPRCGPSPRESPFAFPKAPLFFHLGNAAELPLLFPLGNTPLIPPFSFSFNFFLFFFSFRVARGGSSL